VPGAKNVPVDALKFAFTRSNVLVQVIIVVTVVLGYFAHSYCYPRIVRARAECGEPCNVVNRLKTAMGRLTCRLEPARALEVTIVYWPVDGIHTGMRSENSDGQCLLIIIGISPKGKKERGTIGDGYRKSKVSWRELLLDLKARSLRAGAIAGIRWRRVGFLGRVGGSVSNYLCAALLVSPV
jgi:hypothetical protein